MALPRLRDGTLGTLKGQNLGTGRAEWDIEGRFRVLKHLFLWPIHSTGFTFEANNLIILYGGLPGHENIRVSKVSALKCDYA